VLAAAPVQRRRGFFLLVMISDVKSNGARMGSQRLR